MLSNASKTVLKNNFYEELILFSLKMEISNLEYLDLHMTEKTQFLTPIFIAWNIVFIISMSNHLEIS